MTCASLRSLSGRKTPRPPIGLVILNPEVYIESVSERTKTTTIRLDSANIEASAHARADGLSGSEFVRRGPHGETAKRPPTTGLFVSTDPRLGDESELFADLDG